MCAYYKECSETSSDNGKERRKVNSISEVKNDWTIPLEKKSQKKKQVST